MGNGTQDPLRGRLFSFGGSIQQSCGLLHGEERRPLGRPWGAAGRRWPGIFSLGGGHPHLPGSVCHGLRGRQRGGQRGNVCTTVFSSPLVGWISEYIGLIIPFAVFEDLPGSVCLWQRGRQGGGRRKPVTDGFPPASGKGSRGNLLPAAHVTGCEAGWSLRPLKREA